MTVAGMQLSRSLVGLAGKEAILRAAAALTARDEFGVVSFNESAHWVVHTAPLG